jgi:hypothetical protein
MGIENLSWEMCEATSVGYRAERVCKGEAKVIGGEIWKRFPATSRAML